MKDSTPVSVKKYSKNELDASQWMNFAACAGKTEMMFPRGHKDITYIPGARKLCRSCPVSEPCLEYALQFPATDMHGVWAEHTPRQLAAEQRRRGISPTKPTLARSWGE